DIGSITKVFTALALSEMARRGDVALNDPVARYLSPTLTLPRDGDRQITLADLATHTSSLPLRPDNLVSKDPDNKYAGYTVARLHRFASSFRPVRAIGSQYEYSNVGYALLGTALARRAGLGYRELIRARITGPLGMRDTRMELSPGMRRRLASGHTSELAPARHWDMGALESAGGLRSTAGDLLRFLEAILGYRKSGLAPAMAAMLETRRKGGMLPSTYIALAWNIYQDGGREIAWKNGSVGGYRAFIGYDPARRIGVVALANAQTAGGADDIGLHLLDPQTPVDLHIPRAHKAIKVSAAILERYVGRYKYSDTDILTVTREGDHLFGQEPGQDRIELFAEGERDFFIQVVDAQVTFELSPHGTASAAIWHQAGQDQRGTRMP
ncbi:MAG TPA: serine hydrolase, partial [Candidatus Acidoferrum sp.]|nr:serine hydrolase [Candidatus Acidoferrum sp.]